MPCMIPPLALCKVSELMPLMLMQKRRELWTQSLLQRAKGKAPQDHVEARVQGLAAHSTRRSFMVSPAAHTIKWVTEKAADTFGGIDVATPSKWVYSRDNPPKGESKGKQRRPETLPDAALTVLAETLKKLAIEVDISLSWTKAFHRVVQPRSRFSTKALAVLCQLDLFQMVCMSTSAPASGKNSVSLMKLVATLGNRIQEDHDPAKHEDKVHWLLLLDIARGHSSAETMELRATCRRGLHASLESSHLHVLLHGKLERVPLAELRALLPLWCGAALTHVQSMPSIPTRAWAWLHEEPADDDALAAAVHLHENGNLFIKAAEVLVEEGPDFDLLAEEQDAEAEVEVEGADLLVQEDEVAESVLAADAASVLSKKKPLYSLRVVYGQLEPK
eukprot:1943241-Amphidinium_carterae.1